MIAAFLAQLSVIYVPAFQWVFRTEPITINEWIQILIVSSTVIFAVEIDKLLRRKRSVKKAEELWNMNF
jgi:Ca2+-transporting ATPase